MSKESSEIATGNLQKSERTKKAREACVYVWPILTSMYGHKFTSQFGESADPTWVACLKGLNELQIKTGLETCLKTYPVWPPGAAQYRALCEGRVLDENGKDGSWQQQGAAYVDFNDPAHPSYEPKRIESDEAKEIKRENAKSQIAKLKNILK